MEEILLIIYERVKFPPVSKAILVYLFTGFILSMTIGNSLEMATKFNDVRLKDSPMDSGEGEDAQHYSRSNLGPISSFGLPRLYKEVRISLENCLLPEERLQTSPSLSDGLDVEIERDLRVLGCELIQSSSIMLKLPQVKFSSSYCK